MLEITAISGEYPAENICRLISAPSYAKKVVYALSSRGLLTLISSGELKGYRLALKCKRKVMEDNAARFGGLLEGSSETNRMKPEYERRLRLHSIAQVYTLMYNIGVCIFQDTKFKIYMPAGAIASSPYALSQTTIRNSVNYALSNQNGSSLSQSSTSPLITIPCFYSSREQKSDDNKSNAIRGSRAMGTLFTPTHVYAVYNTGHINIGWHEKIEQRYKAEVRNTILGRGLNQYSGINFLTHAYHPFYYITNNDAHGEAQLKLLCNADRQ